KSQIAAMVANSSFEVRPTAIYANPVLLDLIDREMKSEFNVVLQTAEITGGFRVKMLSTQAGDLPLIPEWSLSYTGVPGSGSAVAEICPERSEGAISLPICMGNDMVPSSLRSFGKKQKLSPTSILPYTNPTASMPPPPTRGLPQLQP